MFCLIVLCGSANAQTASAPTVPTEVGTTKMPPGSYLLIDQNTGNKYSLEVTSKGTMIFGPAPTTATGTTAVSAPSTTAPTAATPMSTATSKATSGVKGLAEKEAQKFIMNKGMSEIQNFVK